MKKLIALLLVFVILLSLAACGSNSNDPTVAPTDAPTEPAPTDPTDPAPTDPDPVDPAPVDVTGTYKGTYEKAAMGSTVVYTYHIVLTDDMSYSFCSAFSMMGEAVSRVEVGSYAVDGGKITFTAQTVDGEPVAEPTTAEGTIADGTIKAALFLSAMASAAQEIEAKLVDPALEAAIGTYSGAYEKSAMGSTVEYSYSIVLNGDMSYTFTSAFSMMGEDVVRVENGSFALDGNKITFTAQTVDGEAVAEAAAVEGTIADGTIKAAFFLSAMASAAQEIEATRLTVAG